MDPLSALKDQFEPELWQEIEKIAVPKNYSAGDIIIDEGEYVKYIPFVLKGTVKVVRTDEEDHELLLYYIDASESCAMTFTCCMQEYPSEIRATAEGDVELWMIPIRVMDEWIVKFPTWKSFVMRTIRTRFKEVLNALDQIAFHKLDDRLVQYLNNKAAHTGSKVLNISHEQVALDLSSSRVVISRLLKALEKSGKIRLGRSEIKLLETL